MATGRTLTGNLDEGSTARASQVGAGLGLDLDKAGLGASGNLAGKLYSVNHGKGFTRFEIRRNAS